MAIELKFTKSDCDTPWGFRLTGGAEFDVPITVIKVAEDSISDRGGLRTGDIVVGINDTPTGGLTHGQTHDLLVAAGDCLILAVRRYDEDDAQQDEYHHQRADEEVEEILNRNDDDDDDDTVTKEKKVHFEEKSVIRTEPTEVEIACKLEDQGAPENAERKWSTFLQRPKNAKPAERKPDIDIPKGAPYRVIIKKQKRRTPEERAQAKLEQFTQKLQIEEKSECSIVVDQQSSMVSENEIEVNMEIAEEEIITTADTDNDEEIEDSLILSSTSEDINKSSEKSNATSVKQKTLEAKLEEIQKQLLALSLLPTTIQSTLDAVSKELANIVHASMNLDSQEVEDEDINHNGEVQCDDDNLSEANTATENELTPEGDDSEHCGEIPKNDENEDQHSETEEVSQQLQENHQEIQQQKEEYDSDVGLTEEEKEAKHIARQRMDKMEKDREEFLERRVKQRPTLPLKPIERPIILPGGRRWSQPDDACPAVKNPKMSDEKIATTIETFSEVIMGKTKGINFLKYQPPPANLEHLQRSEVYKLVHHTEPPVRGISSRACKILAEQDYYEQTKEV